jgi:hypothetical protein
LADYLRAVPLPPWLLHAIGLGGLAGFGGGAFLERGFPAQLHAALVVDADAFHPDPSDPDAPEARSINLSSKPDFTELKISDSRFQIETESTAKINLQSSCLALVQTGAFSKYSVCPWMS